MSLSQSLFAQSLSESPLQCCSFTVYSTTQTTMYLGTKSASEIRQSPNNIDPVGSFI